MKAWSRKSLAPGAFALALLSSQAVLAAPGQTSGYRQFDKRYNDGNLNDGQHGFFLNIGSNTTAFHGDAGTTSEQMALAVVFEFLKADARLFGRKEVLFDGGLDGQASRQGVALGQAYTCAKGRLRILGSETLARPGTCDTRPVDMLMEQGKEISKTFFSKNGDVDVAFFTVSLKLEARGTLSMNLKADTRNASATQGSTQVSANASGNLEVIGKLSAGVDYVARVEVKGKVKLIDISFTPRAAAARAYDRTRPFAERARYKIVVETPLTVRGLDGKVSVAAYGNPTIIVPFFIVPIEVKLDEVTVWDPAPLVSFTGQIHSGSATESYAADFGI